MRYLFMCPFNPLPFVSSLGVGLPDSEPGGDIGADPVIAFGLKGGIDDLRHKNNLIAVFPAVLQPPGFELGAGRKKKIGETCRGGEKIVLYDQKLNPAFVGQDFCRAVDVAVLVDEAVGCNGPDKLDVALQPVDTPDAVFRGHG